MNFQTTNQKSILIVDDIADNLRFLSNMLAEQGYDVRCARSGRAALNAVTMMTPDLILLDISMPDMDGYDVCQQFKLKQQTQNIPIIFLSALNDIQKKAKAFAMGGVDYITKPFQIEEVLLRINNHLELESAKNQIQHLNQRLQQQIVKAQERTIQLEIINQKLEQEAIARSQAEQKLIHDALYDNLTQLPNRNLLMQRLDRAIAQSKQTSQHSALLFIDLDRFKIINDSFGHLFGDRLLVAISQILSASLRKQDLAARLGGDEFVILLDGINEPQDAIAIGEHLQKALQVPLEIDDITVHTGASIGIVTGLNTYSHSEEILRDADIAMYSAKDRGRACYQVFNSQMYLQTLKKLELEQNLRLAIENKEFSLHYQPIFALEDNSLKGFEALIRWQHPQLGFISPADFIPIAEDTGLIIPIGEWVLNSACQQITAWKNKYTHVPGINKLIISVNVACQQFQQPDFIDKLDTIISQTQIDPSCLRLEITERVLIDLGNTQQTFSAIRSRNIKLSIDDFGTGYSSLSYLRHLPIDNLKIDRSFISNLNCDRESLEIVKTIIALAHNLGMDAIAEGIETTEQLKQLTAMGCEFAQGYLLAKPLMPQEIPSRFWLEQTLPQDFRQLATTANVSSC